MLLKDLDFFFNWEHLNKIIYLKSQLVSIFF